MSEIGFSLRKLPVRAFDSRAQGFNTPLAHRRSTCRLPSRNLVRAHAIEHHQVVHPASRVPTVPEEHRIGARRRRAPKNTILNQPYRRRVSNDRLSPKDSQLAASLEVDPGPTPAGKTFPHSYPKTRFRRESAIVTVKNLYFCVKHFFFFPLCTRSARGRSRAMLADHEQRD